MRAPQTVRQTTLAHTQQRNHTFRKPKSFRALPRRTRLLQSEVSRPVLRARVSSSILIKLYDQNTHCLDVRARWENLTKFPGATRRDGKGPKFSGATRRNPTRWCKKAQNFSTLRARRDITRFPTHIKYVSTALFFRLAKSEKGMPRRLTATPTVMAPDPWMKISKSGNRPPLVR